MAESDVEVKFGAQTAGVDKAFETIRQQLGTLADQVKTTSAAMGASSVAGEAVAEGAKKGAAGFQLLAGSGNTAAESLRKATAAALLVPGPIADAVVQFGLLNKILNPVGAVVFAVVGALSLFIDRQSAAEKATVLHTKAMQDYKDAIDKAGGSVEYLSAQESKRQRFVLVDDLRKAAAAVKEQTDLINDYIRNAITGEFGYDVYGTGDYTSAILEKIKPLREQFLSGAIDIRQFVEELYRMAEADESLTPLVKRVDELTAGLRTSLDIQDEAAKSLRELEEAAISVGHAFQTAGDFISGYLRDLAGATQELGRQQAQLTARMDAYRTGGVAAYKAVSDAQQDEAEALRIADAAMRNFNGSLEDGVRQHEQIRQAALERLQADRALQAQVEAQIQAEREGAAAYERAQREKEQAAREHAAIMQQIGLDLIETETQMRNIGLAQQREALDLQVQLGQVSNDEKIRQLQGFEQESYQIQRESLQRQRTLLAQDPNGNPAAKARINNQLLVLERQHAANITSINRQAVRDSLAMWQSIVAPLKGAFTGITTGLLQGTLTWKQALANVADSILASYLNMAAQIAIDWLATQAMMLFASQATQEGLASLATDTTTSLVSVAQSIGQIMNSAAVAAAAAYASTAAIPVVGPAAAPAAASAAFLGASAWAGAVMPFARGTPEVPRDMLAQVHAGETIVPASFSDAIRRGDLTLGAGGQAPAPSVTVNLTAYGNLPESMLRQQARYVAKNIRGYLRDNPSWKPDK